MSLEITNLSKIFENNIKALDNVTINFQKNKITGFIGFNGSGKTTTFNIISNFIEKYEGEITLDGKKITRKDLSKFSYLAAGAEPKNTTRVIKHLRGIAYLYGVKKIEADKIINKLAANMDFKQFLNNPIKSLSKGNQQKIKVISSLLNPKMEILLLDEPFDGLDPIMVDKIRKIFMSLKNVSIILTSHRMEVVQEMCEEFYVLKNGILIDSRRTDDETIIVEVNKEISLTQINKLKYVKKITKGNKKNSIVIDNIKNYKDLNKKLIASPKYIFSSIKDKNIAEIVFEGYGV